MFKKVILPLIAIFSIAILACSGQVVSTPTAAPATAAPLVIIATPPPAPATSTPEIVPPASDDHCPPGAYQTSDGCLELPETKAGDIVSLADPNAPSIVLFTDNGIWACAVSHCSGGFWTDGREGSPSMPRAVLFYNFSVEPEWYGVIEIEGDFEQAKWDNAFVVLGTRFIGTPLAEYRGELIADITDIKMLIDAEDICFTGNGLSPIGICTP